MERLRQSRNHEIRGSYNNVLCRHVVLGFVFLMSSVLLTAQDKKVNLQYKNAPLKQVLDNIQEQTGYRFLYTERVDVRRTVDVEASDEPVEDVLSNLLAITGNGYRLMEDNLIVISNREAAQPGTVSGTVKDASSGEPLPGVNVVEKGTTNGTITDLQGNYSIRLGTEEPVLVFSFIGYISREVPVDDRAVIDLSLSEDLVKLEEVIVIGYGTQDKEDLTGAVSVIEVDEMTKSNFTTFDKALQGRAAGVHVTSTSGRPGAAASVKIRGISSISLSSEPLYVVDGIPINEEILNVLNPQDIESIHVLKDASATAIYGARASNGVIMITTRRGVGEKSQIRFNSNIGFSFIPRTYDVMNADQYSEFTKATWDTYAERSGIGDDKNLYLQVYSPEARAENENLDTDTGWQKEITRIGKTQNYNLSFSGSNDNNNYYFSANYANEEGILINTGLERFTLRANSDFKLSDRIKIGESMTLSRLDLEEESHYTNGNPWHVAVITSPLMPVYDSTALGGFGGPTDTLTGANERTNPVAEQTLNVNTTLEYKILSSFYADIKLLKGLTYTIRVGANFKFDEQRRWSPKYTLGNMKLRDREQSKLILDNGTSQDYLFNNTLTYSNQFGGHNITGMLGYEQTRISWKWNGMEGADITNLELPVMDQAETPQRVYGGEEEHNLESFLGRFIYDYEGKYLLTASVRVDGSSRFSPKAGRYGTFPSFSLGWKINEDFLQTVKQINMLKLRVGWGQTGNENLDDYMYFDLIDPLKNSRYIFGTNQDLWLGGAVTSFQSNPLIKWEAAEMTNIGADLNAFGNRLQVTAEYYIKNQNDMLVRKPISKVFGKYSEYGGDPDVGAWVNLAKVQNRGFELSTTWRQMEGDFQYSLSANITQMKNEVIDPGVSEIKSTYSIAKPGHSLGSFYGYVAEGILQMDDFEQDEDGNLVTDAKGNYNYLGPKQETETSPGDIKFKDLNLDGKIDDFDRIIIGKPLPDFIYGLNFNAWFKGFDLTLFLQGMQNMEVYNNLFAKINNASGDDRGKDENKLVNVLNYWTPENPTNEQTRPYVIDVNLNNRISSWWVEDASFVRIKTLQLGYSLPVQFARRLGIGRFRVYGNVNNLLTLTRYQGYDPEIGDTNPLVAGIDNGYYPIPRTWSFGVQVDF